MQVLFITSNSMYNMLVCVNCVSLELENVYTTGYIYFTNKHEKTHTHTSKRSIHHIVLCRCDYMAIERSQFPTNKYGVKRVHPQSVEFIRGVRAIHCVLDVVVVETNIISSVKPPPPQLLVAAVVVVTIIISAASSAWHGGRFFCSARSVIAIAVFGTVVAALVALLTVAGFSSTVNRFSMSASAFVCIGSCCCSIGCRSHCTSIDDEADDGCGDGADVFDGDDDSEDDEKLDEEFVHSLDMNSLGVLRPPPLSVESGLGQVNVVWW